MRPCLILPKVTLMRDSPNVWLRFLIPPQTPIDKVTAICSLINSYHFHFLQFIDPTCSLFLPLFATASSKWIELRRYVAMALHLPVVTPASRHHGSTISVPGCQLGSQLPEQLLLYTSLQLSLCYLLKPLCPPQTIITRSPHRHPHNGGRSR